MVDDWLILTVCQSIVLYLQVTEARLFFIYINIFAQLLLKRFLHTVLFRMNECFNISI